MVSEHFKIPFQVIQDGPRAFQNTFQVIQDGPRAFQNTIPSHSGWSASISKYHSKSLRMVREHFKIPFQVTQDGPPLFQITEPKFQGQKKHH
ncbi:hypothetical protein DMA11_10735 [Marinilabiliaceae bacterium JC017]|nr:hypothetical protein DMA11_10735 [Marinilabiliaceae bacterium JC017]